MTTSTISMDEPQTPMSRIRRELESFLWWYVPVSLMVGLMAQYGIPWVLEQVKEGKLGQSEMVVMWISMSSMMVSKIVAVVWIWKRQHPGMKIRVLWTLFALLAPLWAVGLYLVVRVLETLRPEAEVREVDRNASR